MKRSELLRHLRRNGCTLKREGASHSLWTNPATGQIGVGVKSLFLVFLEDATDAGERAVEASRATLYRAARSKV
jgi:hypothetical protein